MFIDLVLALDTCGLVANLACFRMPETRYGGRIEVPLERLRMLLGSLVRSLVSLHRFRVKLRNCLIRNRKKCWEIMRNKLLISTMVFQLQIWVVLHICVQFYKLKFPQKSCEPEMADTDLFSAFLKRIPSLFIRRPEVTSIIRAMNFNIFFDNFSKFFTETNLDLIMCTMTMSQAHIMFKLLIRLMLQRVKSKYAP